MKSSRPLSATLGCCSSFQLLPLLGASPLARVISVLGGGLETTHLIDLDDLDLKTPANFTVYRARLQYIAINTLMLDKLASARIPILHSSTRCPGAVNTGNVRRGWDVNSVVGGAFTRAVEFLTWLAGFSDDESGQRHLFESTTAAFGGRGVPWTGKPGITTTGGLFLVNNKCDCTPNAKVVARPSRDWPGEGVGPHAGGSWAISPALHGNGGPDSGPSASSYG